MAAYVYEGSMKHFVLPWKRSGSEYVLFFKFLSAKKPASPELDSLYSCLWHATPLSLQLGNHKFLLETWVPLSWPPEEVNYSTRAAF